MEIATIQVGSIDEVQALPPIKRWLVLLFWLAIRDRARAIHHEYQPGLTRLAREIDEEWHELEPIPEVMGPLVAEEILDWINPSRFRRALADWFRKLADRLDPQRVAAIESRFLLILGSSWTIWEVTIQPGEDRATTTFELLDCTETNRDQAALVELGSLSETIDQDEMDRWYPGWF